MGSPTVYLNGGLVPAAEARIDVADAGFLHGASVYTTMLARNGAVFRLDRHLARLGETVHFLQLRADATAAGLADAVARVLDANELADARVRITLTPGPVGAGQPTTLVTAAPLPDYPPQWYAKGIGAVVTSLKQLTGSPVYGWKTGCYLPRILARQEAAAKGADEALWFTPDNRLAEGCTSNVFLVLEGEVFTPPRDTPVLPGIVREAVGELCGELGVPHHDDRPLTIQETLAAAEVFMTASCTGIRPVVRIERHAVGDEKPGKITRRIMAAYRRLLETECPAGNEGNAR